MNCLTARMIKPHPILHSNIHTWTGHTSGPVHKQSQSANKQLYAGVTGSKNNGEGCSSPFHSQIALILHLLITVNSWMKFASRFAYATISPNIFLKHTHSFLFFLQNRITVSSFGNRRLSTWRRVASQRCSPNQRQTLTITSFTCIRNSALFMNPYS